MLALDFPLSAPSFASPARPSSRRRAGCSRHHPVPKSIRDSCSGSPAQRGIPQAPSRWDPTVVVLPACPSRPHSVLDGRSRNLRRRQSGSEKWRPTGYAPRVHRDRAQSAPPAGQVGHATSWRMAPHLPGLDLVEIDPEAEEETDPALLRALLRRWRRHKPVPLERHSRSSRSLE